MEYLADCPVCQQISKGKIEKEGKLCCLVTIGKLRIAALKGHESDALPEALSEAFSLLQHQASDGFIGEYPDAPGHWAVHMIKSSVAKGQSVGKSE